MKEDGQQKELFEFEKPRKQFPGLSRLFRKSDFDGTLAITVTLDKLALIAIGATMVMVVVFALGVERGRAVVKRVVGETTPKAAVTERLAAPKVAPPVTVARQANVVPQMKAPQPTPADASVVGKTKPYTIVAAAFARKEYASQEASRLKKGGLDAFVAQSATYFVVCVGSYADKDSVQSKKALAKVRQLYKDAYFKLQ